MFPIFGLTNSKGEPMVIGFAGKARSGKDTAAKYICDTFNCLHYSFAKPIKESIKIMFQLTDEQERNKEVAIEPWGISPRIMYQRIGTEVGRSLDPNIWVKNAELFTKKHPGRTVVISDVRFSNEALWIRNKGGVVIHISRDKALRIHEHNHASEHGMDEKDYDLTIHNNGTLDELHEKLYSLTESSDSPIDLQRV